MTASTDDGIIVWDYSAPPAANNPEKSEPKAEDATGVSSGDVLPKEDVLLEDIIIEEEGSETPDLISDDEIFELNLDTDVLDAEDGEDEDADSDSVNSVYEKKYYKISEVVSIVNETQPTIRFWEDSFSELGKNFCSLRSRGGTRKFTKENIENLKLIKMLLRERRLTIEGAISEIRNEKKRNAKERALILLQETRDELNSLIDAYNYILHKNVND